jgi:hypothetical protein
MDIQDWQVAAAAAAALLVVGVVLMGVSARGRRWAEMPAMVCCGLFLMTASATATLGRPGLAHGFQENHLPGGR